MSAILVKILEGLIRGLGIGIILLEAVIGLLIELKNWRTS